MLSMLEQFLIAAFAGLLLWAAASDVARFVIPNRICAAIAALWPAYAAARLGGGLSLHDAAFGLAFGAGALVAGFLLFAMRLVGGGDVKLFAATALWAGPALGLPFVFVVLAGGGILALSYLAFRTLRAMCDAPVPGLPRANLGGAIAGALRSEVPFGVAIALGGLFVAWRLFFGL